MVRFTHEIDTINLNTANVTSKRGKTYLVAETFDKTLTKKINFLFLFSFCFLFLVYSTIIWVTKTNKTSRTFTYLNATLTE